MPAPALLLLLGNKTDALLTSAKPPIMVRQYYNDKTKDWSMHFPPAWEDERDATNDCGPPFYAYDYAAPGTILIHQYYNDGDRDWSFHEAPAWPSQRDATDDCGPSFYAFDHQAPGTTAIHQYYHHGDKDWSMHTPPTWSGQADLTGKYGPKFYAYTSIFCGWPTPTSIGNWVMVGSSNAPTDLTYLSGTRTSSSHQQTTDWSMQVTAGMSADFLFGSVHIDTTISFGMSQTWSSTFESYKESTFETHFPAGVYWQFEIEVRDSCGGALAKGHFLRYTSSANEMPCCLPGYFMSETSNTCTSPAVTRAGCGSSVLV